MKIQASNLSAQYRLGGEMELVVTVDKRHVGEVEAAYEKLKGKALSVEVKPFRQKRSLDANAYAWVLMDKIAEALSNDEVTVTKADVYRDMIRHTAGAFEVIPLKNEAVERFIEAWQANGLGWMCDTAESAIDGFTNVFAFYGSSVYDSREMARLVDAAIAQAKELSIEVLSPDELERIKKEWKR